MINRCCRFRCLCGLVLALSVAGTADAQRAEGEPPVSPRRDRLEFVRQRLRPCELFIVDAPKRRCEAVAEPIAVFENPVSQILDGFIFLWTDRGRPAALVKSYYNLGRESWGRTFVSLAMQPMEMRVGGEKLRAPKEAALSFSPLADALEPAAQPRQRLTQMREIARRFQVVDHWGLKDPTDWQLRLLTTPLYRYEVPEEKVVDGALFGYVLTTSPEAVVLLEARKTDTGLAWHYAVSRCTRFEIRFSLDGKPIATFPRLESWPASEVYFHDPIPMADYPFKGGRGTAAPAR